VSRTNTRVVPLGPNSALLVTLQADCDVPPLLARTNVVFGSPAGLPQLRSRLRMEKPQRRHDDYCYEGRDAPHEVDCVTDYVVTVDSPFIDSLFYSKTGTTSNGF
jgi:hypothetical protein